MSKRGVTIDDAVVEITVNRRPRMPGYVDRPYVPPAVKVSEPEPAPKEEDFYDQYGGTTIKPYSEQQAADWADKVLIGLTGNATQWISTQSAVDWVKSMENVTTVATTAYVPFTSPTTVKTFTLNDVIAAGKMYTNKVTPVEPASIEGYFDPASPSINPEVIKAEIAWVYKEADKLTKALGPKPAKKDTEKIKKILSYMDWLAQQLGPNG